VRWGGSAFWDMIQPSFMFMVGVALPYSYHSRKSRGDSGVYIVTHAVWRSLVLILLGIFLVSNGQLWNRNLAPADRGTLITFTNVLSQIGLGYCFLYLLLGRPLWLQMSAAAVVLIGYWIAFATHPLPQADFDYSKVSASWQHGEIYEGFFAHWSKNSNFSSHFDVWFLNLFPHRPDKPFHHNFGGYGTLNFIPSFVTMLFGVMVGEFLRSQSSAKVGWLCLAGIVGVLLGSVLDMTVCPSVKRIWTPSWAILSTGWTCLMLAFFYLIIDVWGFQAWSWPFVIAGMNSIAIYAMHSLGRTWIAETFKLHLGQDFFDGTFGRFSQSVCVLAVLWLVCWWMYRRKLFLKV
jgi:predicted acyltransferase